VGSNNEESFGCTGTFINWLKELAGIQDAAGALAVSSTLY
jgi:hypothetical protein